jgi:hypothetical protein
VRAVLAAGRGIGGTYSDRLTAWTAASGTGGAQLPACDCPR